MMICSHLLKMQHLTRRIIRLTVSAGLAGQGDKLVLSTVHSAKGLEWQAVFVISLVEGKFPSGMAKTTSEFEEERRLLYVAATRAKRQLFLVYPEMTASPGHFAEPALISRFLDELPASLTATGKKTLNYSPSKQVRCRNLNMYRQNRPLVEIFLISTFGILFLARDRLLKKLIRTPCRYFLNGMARR